MNIIKFRNEKCVDSSIDQSVRDLYNNYFKGRYCYALQCKRVVLMRPEDEVYHYYSLEPCSPETPDQPVIYNYKEFPAEILTEVLEKKGLTDKDIKTIGYVPSEPLVEGVFDQKTHIMSEIKQWQILRVFVNGIMPSEYIDWEKKDDVKKALDEKGIFSIGFDKFKGYILKVDSDLYKNTEYYEYENEKYNAIGDIDISLLRLYRSKVAGFIDKGIKAGALDWCIKKKALISYYKNNMNNATIETIEMMQQTHSITLGVLTPSNNCGCGCGGQTSMLSSSLSGLTYTCDLLKEYRAMMKEYMISLFSDIEFWKDITLHYKVALDHIIDYTKALAKSGLSPFTNSTSLDISCPCKLVSDSEILYKNFVKELEDIALAFEYILKEDWTHKSFIIVELARFAQYYEYLQWDGYIAEGIENFE